MMAAGIRAEYVYHTCGAKGFNGEELALFHAGGLAALHNGHALARVDAIRPYAVPVQVAYLRRR